MFAELNQGGSKFDYTARNNDTFKSTIDYLKDISEGKCDNKEVIKGFEDNTSKEKVDAYPVHGYFFFETVHGDSGALLLEDCNLYIPKHMLKIFKDMTEEQDNAIRDGKLGISFYEYNSKKRADCVGIKLHDIG